jgi:hypothetical protein
LPSGSRAAEKLRSQHSVAAGVTVFLRTNPFNPKELQTGIKNPKNQITVLAQALIIPL